MRNGVGPVCLALLLGTSAVHADILPTDRGLRSGSAGSLDFSIHSATEKMPTGYYKSVRVVVLDGCIEGQPNCVLARSKNLIGMEVKTVDGQYLRLENGMVRQILDAFANKSGPATVTLELHSPAPDGGTIKVSFARD